MITNNIKTIFKNIESTGREVRIVAATKTVDPQRINLLNGLGISTMGENRVQELLSKYDDLEMDDIHFIGGLQTNKVKYIVDKVSMIQSVDRLSLANEIDRRCKAIDKVMPILLEVNVGQEESKSGTTAEELFKLASEIENLQNVEVQGIMSVLPIGADASLYQKMHELFVAMKDKYSTVKYLSMGMSDDYMIAIENGANMVRLGSIIFGRR